MEYFLQQLINGLTLGAIYGLIAIGYTMVYGIVGMINFAHGEVYMIGAFISIITFIVLGLGGITFIPLALMVVLLSAMVFTAAYGWTVERIAYRPLRHSFRLAPMLSAIGMSFVLINYSQVAQGARVKPVPPIVTGGHTLHESADGFVVQLSNVQILVVITTIVLLSIFTWLVAKTRLGRDMRACEQDQTMAALLGVDVDRTISMTFVIGAALASVAGVMYLLYYGLVDFFMGFVAGIKAFTAAVSRLSAAGAHIVEVPMRMLAEAKDLYLISPYEAYPWHQALLSQRKQDYDPRVVSRILLGAHATEDDKDRLRRARACSFC